MASDNQSDAVQGAEGLGDVPQPGNWEVTPLLACVFVTVFTVFGGWFKGTPLANHPRGASYIETYPYGI